MYLLKSKAPVYDTPKAAPTVIAVLQLASAKNQKCTTKRFYSGLITLPANAEARLLA